MEKFDEVLKTATAAVEEGYFELNIAGGASVFRERVYCYELYHQMRAVWPPGCEYMLSGEIDKRGHLILRNLGADAKQPDLLIHTPGQMNNFAIIEVKHTVVVEGIRKDLQTLDLFVRQVDYQRGIYLLYGTNATADSAERICAIARNLEVRSPIEIWLHSNAGQAASMYCTIGAQ